MENIPNILNLPEEVLLKILTFVPNRFDYALVCKKFYNLTCEIDKFKYKLIAGSARTTLVDKTCVRCTSRRFDAMDVHIEFKSSDDVELLRDIFQIHGETLKILNWSNWTNFVFNEDEIVEMLNYLPNLEELRLGAWDQQFTKSESSNKKLLNLQKLKKLNVSSYKKFIFEFLEKYLPENIIVDLKIDRSPIPAELFKSFIDKQLSIKNLDFDASKYDSAEIFKDLKLNQMRCSLSSNDVPETRYEFLLSLIKCQPHLRSLDLLDATSYSFCFVDDETFEEIVKLQFLETLKLSIVGVTNDSIGQIQKLKNLRDLVLDVKGKHCIETLNELGLMKLPIENLYLKLWTFEIPEHVYRQFGENFNLKSLRIKMGTWHPINFFIESFPKLESLNIRFGEANNTVELSRVFNGEDLKIHSNMKSLELEFWGSELISCENFLKLLSCFPNLEKLNISSKFPFTTEFFNLLISDLNLIKSLEISGIFVDGEENFPPEIIESMKKVSTKFDFCRLLLKNVEEIRMLRNNDGKRIGTIRNFSFEPLKISLKDNFKINETCWSNIRITKQLKLTSF